MISLLISFLFCLQMPQVQGENVNTEESDDISFMEAIRDISARFNVFFTFDRALVEGLTVEKSYTEIPNVDDAVAFVLEDTNLKYRIIQKRYVIIYQNNEDDVNSMEEMIRHMEGMIEVESKKSKIRANNKEVGLLKTKELRKIFNKRLVLNISGTIVNEYGGPLVGANVIVKGTKKGTATDFDGSFLLEDVGQNAVLTITSIGYRSEEVKVSGRSSIDIRLSSNAQKLDEIVVTALGIKRDEKSLTYAAQKVDNNDFSVAKEINVVNSLQGKIAGAVISRSATGPGGSSKVILRGNRSITGENEPLYIIDGVPLNTGRRSSGGGDFGGRDGGGGISMLNPDNIESMTVLKGASAAALYGSAGQNGVIVINTKSGKAGKIQLEYNGSVIFDRAFYLPEFQSQYGQGDGGVYSPNSEHSYGAKADGREVVLWNGDKVPYSNHTDNMANFFRTGITYNNSFSVTGGNDKMRTFFSYGNVTAGGIMPNNDMVRHNLDLKIDNEINDKLSLTTKLTYISQEIDNMPHTGERGYALASIYRAPLSIPLDKMKEFNYFDESGVERQNYWKPNSAILENPYWGLNRVLFFEKKDRVLGLIQARYQFTDWLDLMVRANIDRTFEKIDDRFYNDTYQAFGLGSNLSVGDYFRESTNIDALLTMLDRRISDELRLDLRAGASMRQGNANSSTTDANGLYKVNYFFLSNAKNPISSQSASKSPQVQSLYGLATLSYRDYLYLDLTARNDWSSALPKDNWSYFYPSIGISWLVSEMVNLPSWVNYGKIRLSYAESGNGGGAYRTRDYYSVVAGGGIQTPTTKNLPDYKPELTSSYEIGAEWWFVNRKLGFDFTYYTTDTKNQLITITTPPSSLFSSQYINAGLINNRGIETSLFLTPVSVENFTWRSTFNFSKNINTVKRLSPDLKRFIITDERVVMVTVDEGGSYGDVYGTGWRRDEQNRPLVDAEGMPLLTGGKDVYLGNYNPDYMLGFNNTLRFKGIKLSFLIDYRKGGVVTSQTQALLDADGHSKASLWGREDGIVLDAYTVDGEKNTQRIDPQSYFGLIGERYASGEFYSYQGTNVRLREVTIGYDFNKVMSKDNVLAGLRVSLVGRNLFFLYNEAPFDPEVLTGIGNYGAIEYAALPTSRSIGINVQLSF
ncbi:SusC/RagA family TonB-linked outer membrane protein [Membranihabitans maritimus]|uniref:SusC/RagA family TonB-linked outer membrane protein n=1 Tax=Membranihabitans maritimus TaxID=2904244 RepID=UPI001F030A8A|nr:SusC/RagA family TonB-linked outer membrane protein [Membranihabitans maritimus]